MLTVVLFLASVVQNLQPEVETDDFPFDACWVLVDKAKMHLADGTTVDLPLGEMLFIEAKEDEKLSVCQVTFVRIQARGWIKKEDVGSCFQVFDRFVPEHLDKKIRDYRKYIALAEAMAVADHVTRGPMGLNEIKSYLRSAEKLCKDDVRLLWNWAFSVTWYQEKEERMKQLDLLVEKLPDNATARFFRGVAKYDDKDFSGAARDFEKAKELFNIPGAEYVEEKEHLKDIEELMQKIKNSEDGLEAEKTPPKTAE